MYLIFVVYAFVYVQHSVNPGFKSFINKAGMVVSAVTIVQVSTWSTGVDVTVTFGFFFSFLKMFICADELHRALTAVC